MSFRSAFLRSAVVLALAVLGGLLYVAPASAQLRDNETLGAFSFVQDATGSINSFEIIVNATSSVTRTPVSLGSLFINGTSLDALLGRNLILAPGTTLDFTDPSLGLGLNSGIVFDATATQPARATLTGQLFSPATNTAISNANFTAVLAGPGGAALVPNASSAAIVSVVQPTQGVIPEPSTVMLLLPSISLLAASLRLRTRRQRPSPAANNRSR